MLRVLAALSFANVKVDLVWNRADTLNGLMAVPNLIGFILLAPMVSRITRKYFGDRAQPLSSTPMKKA
ncbi:MAG: alanine:cation symporter family protein [Boseongicola sp. SB0673_bin_14]|nr:alanine:cation symporter family protein [Boseongicola sp. SB0667_bin_21]MYI69647.1 alanine:cation symporter family protein [Boseongicola sp. SB0673_bin_14]